MKVFARIVEIFEIDVGWVARFDMILFGILPYIFWSNVTEDEF
jgi:hypothetical protein